MRPSRYMPFDPDNYGTGHTAKHEKLAEIVCRGLLVNSTLIGRQTRKR